MSNTAAPYSRSTSPARPDPAFHSSPESASFERSPRPASPHAFGSMLPPFSPDAPQSPPFSPDAPQSPPAPHPSSASPSPSNTAPPYSDQAVAQLLSGFHIRELTLQDELEARTRQAESLHEGLVSWQHRTMQAQQRTRDALGETQRLLAERAESEKRRVGRVLEEAEAQWGRVVADLTSKMQGQLQEERQTQARDEGRVRARDEEIARLQSAVDGLRSRLAQGAEDKNKEHERLRLHFSQLVASQVRKLAESSNQHHSRLDSELAWLRAALQAKSEEVAELRGELRAQLEAHSAVRKDLEGELALLRAKLVQKDEQATAEILSLKERWSALHAEDLATLERRTGQRIEAMLEESERNRLASSEAAERYEGQLQEAERARESMRQVLRDLREKMRSLEEERQGSTLSTQWEAKQVHEAMARLEEAKQIEVQEARDQASFLSTQLAKLAATNEAKNKEIAELREEIAELKLELSEKMQDNERVSQQERLLREEERRKERSLRERIAFQLQELDTKSRAEARESYRENEAQKRENSRLSSLVHRLEKEIESLLAENSVLGEHRRKEITLGQGLSAQLVGQRLEEGDLRSREREKTEESQRRELALREKQHELEVMRLTAANEDLLGRLLAKEGELRQCEEALSALPGLRKGGESMSVENAAEREQKMALLQGQILVTQNLLDAFVESKASFAGEE